MVNFFKLSGGAKIQVEDHSSMAAVVEAKSLDARETNYPEHQKISSHQRNERKRKNNMLQKENKKQKQKPLEVSQSQMQKMAERMEKLEAKFVAVEKAHREDQMKLNLKIQDLQKQNASLRDENEKLSRKMAELG